MLDLDASDRTILAALQRDGRASIEEMAEQTGLSPATVQRRIKRLRDAVVILRDTAVIDPKKLGWSMSFLVLVELERERLDVLDSFKRRMRDEPQVQQCYYITGDADFALLVLARDMDDYEKLTRRLFFGDTNIRRFRTNVVMGRPKVTLDVPIGL